MRYPCRGSGFGFRVSGFGFRVSGLGSRVSGLGFRVSGFEFLGLGVGFISTTVLIHCFWRNESYYANAVLLIAWLNCLAMFVARKQSIDTFTEMSLGFGVWGLGFGVWGVHGVCLLAHEREANHFSLPQSN